MYGKPPVAGPGVALPVTGYYYTGSALILALGLIVLGIVLVRFAYLRRGARDEG